MGPCGGRQIITNAIVGNMSYPFEVQGSVLCPMWGELYGVVAQGPRSSGRQRGVYRASHRSVRVQTP